MAAPKKGAPAQLEAAAEAVQQGQTMVATAEHAAIELAATLHADVSAAAQAAARAGQHAAHGALHTIEVALGNVRSQVAQAEQQLGVEHAELLARLKSIV